MSHIPPKPIIYPGNEIGRYPTYGHCVLIRENNKIGNHVKLGSYTEIAHHVQIGNRVRIHSKCFIPEYTILDDDCWIGPCVTFVNDPYPLTGGMYRKGAYVGKGAIIGANSTIMAAVKIGSQAVIGAGSVVTKNVPACQVWHGNPATYQKMRTDLKGYK